MWGIVVTLLIDVLNSEALPGLNSCSLWINLHRAGSGSAPGTSKALFGPATSHFAALVAHPWVDQKLGITHCPLWDRAGQAPGAHPLFCAATPLPTGLSWVSKLSLADLAKLCIEPPVASCGCLNKIKNSTLQSHYHISSAQQQCVAMVTLGQHK